MLTLQSATEKNMADMKLLEIPIRENVFKRETTWKMRESYQSWHVWQNMTFLIPFEQLKSVMMSVMMPISSASE